MCGARVGAGVAVGPRGRRLYAADCAPEVLRDADGPCGQLRPAGRSG